MTRTSILDRLLGGPPNIDMNRLEAERARASADLDAANRDQKQLALAVKMGEPGSAERLQRGAERVRKAMDELKLANDAIDGADELTATWRAQQEAREQAEADKRSRAKLDRLVKAAEKVGASAGAYAKDAIELTEAWNDVQPDFVTNPSLIEGARGAHQPRETVAVELVRLANVPGTRPDLLPPGSNVHALPFAHDRDPIGKLYADFAKAVWLKR